MSDEMTMNEVLSVLERIDGDGWNNYNAIVDAGRLMHFRGARDARRALHAVLNELWNAEAVKARLREYIGDGEPFDDTKGSYEALRLLYSQSEPSEDKQSVFEDFLAEHEYTMFADGFTAGYRACLLDIEEMLWNVPKACPNKEKFPKSSPIHRN